MLIPFWQSFVRESFCKLDHRCDSICPNDFFGNVTELYASANGLFCKGKMIRDP